MTTTKEKKEPALDKSILTDALAAKYRVVPWKVIEALPQEVRVAQFANQSTVAQRAFANMGKLYKSISDHLKPSENITNKLSRAGVKSGTISNASYAAKVWGFLIEPGLLDESDYDSFTFADCLAIVRVLSKKSVKQLTPEEVAKFIKEGNGKATEDFDSLYHTGLTVAEEETRVAEEEAEAERERREAEEKNKAAIEQRVQDAAKKAAEEAKKAAEEQAARAAEAAQEKAAAEQAAAVAAALAEAPPAQVIEPPVEAPVEGEVEAPVEGEVEAPVEGEVEAPVEGEVEAPVEGEVEAPVEGEVEPVEGEVEPVEGEAGEESEEGEPVAIQGARFEPEEPSSNGELPEIGSFADVAPDLDEVAEEIDHLVEMILLLSPEDQAEAVARLAAAMETVDAPMHLVAVAA